MLLKLVGAGITIASCTAMGVFVANNYSNRPKQLRELHHALGLLETEVSFALSALPHALSSVAAQTKGLCSELFRKTAERLEKGDAYFAGDAWCDVAKDLYAFSSLCEPELEVILAFGKTLGTSDREDQLKHLQLAKERLLALEREAQEAAEKNARLSSYFGISLGLVVVAILF